MKYILLLLTIGVFQVNAVNWALLVSGSNAFYNYRHQADVCHSYKTLIKNGYSPENVIVFAYDDIAQNRQNIYKGAIYNQPNKDGFSDNVYDGCVIDYSKTDVNPTNFLNVLKGNYDHLPDGHKFINSTREDNIFVYFSDHGSPGLIAFPTSYLYEQELMETFQYMFENNRYNKLVFYLETCESGSMFVNLPKDHRIYALSAANPYESSWGTYCPPDDIVNGKNLGTCLGDEFSVTFLENVDLGDFSQTLQEHFEFIRDNTLKSNVMQWGDLSFTSETIKEFFWGRKFLEKRKMCPKDAFFMNDENVSRWDSRDNKLLFYQNRYNQTGDLEDFIELEKEIKSRAYFDTIFGELQQSLKLTGDYHFALNQNCLKSVIEIFENKCTKLTDYGLKYVKLFGEMCDSTNLLQIQLNMIVSSLCMTE
ncbi:unnamed protein product [Paramecium primaurelia]|uniref:legumain n=1 Tax=Paramecium primaurelia TaxID=5886 RepID=A0A8S1LKT3_PARPR|nr:unnamed protein product [Paramecium primaurelia]